MKTFYTGLSLLLLTACGGGGGSDDFTNALTGSSDVRNDGCEQEYYQTIIGNYSGLIELSDDNARAPRVCTWTTTANITGQSILATCQLTVSTEASVEQFTFYPDDIVDRYQCIEDQGSRFVREPFDNLSPVTELPGLDNSLFPINMDFSGDAGIPSRGPNFGDENLLGFYFYLFDGSPVNIVDNLTVNGDGTLTVRDGNGVLLGNLIKE